MKYYVYTFTYKHIMYIGRTKRLVEREKEHNRNIRNKNTAVYKALRAEGCIKVTLEVCKVFNNSLDAKRYEAFLILERYFLGYPLYQTIPKIF